MFVILSQPTPSFILAALPADVRARSSPWHCEKCAKNPKDVLHAHFCHTLWQCDRTTHACHAVVSLPLTGSHRRPVPAL